MAFLQERRRAERFSMEDSYMYINAKKIRTEAGVTGKICDISSVGVRFVSCQPYKEKQDVEIGLLLPRYGSVRNISARVCRCIPREDETFETALEFEEDPFQQSFINDYIRVMRICNKTYS